MRMSDWSSDVCSSDLMEAIRSATANAAYAMNMQDKIGTIEVGKLADLLVVIGDPLANIRVLQDKANLEVIMKDGSIVDTTTPLPTTIGRASCRERVCNYV